MIYSALSIARYIITRCNESGMLISNLKLQKILYFLWIEYYNQTGKYLFLDNFCAWQFGPVVPEVYYEYCVYGGRTINAIYKETLGDSYTEKIIDNVLEQYMTLTVGELVERSHRKKSAWDSVYDNGNGKGKVIPFWMIKECGN